MPPPLNRKSFYLKFLKDIETRLRGHAGADGQFPDDSLSVQELKELWTILAGHYAQEFEEDPPAPFWESARRNDPAGS